MSHTTQPAPPGHCSVSSIHQPLCDSEITHGTDARLRLAAAMSARSQFSMACWLATGWDQKASLSHITKCASPSSKL
jgi:hypothetical protein